MSSQSTVKLSVHAPNRVSALLVVRTGPGLGHLDLLCLYVGN